MTGTIFWIRTCTVAPAEAAIDSAAGSEVHLPAGTFLLTRTLRFRAPGTPEQVSALALKAAKASGAQVRGFKLAERTLEEAFISALEGK